MEVNDTLVYMVVENDKNNRLGIVVYDISSTKGYGFRFLYGRDNFEEFPARSTSVVASTSRGDNLLLRYLFEAKQRPK